MAIWSSEKNQMCEERPCIGPRALGESASRKVVPIVFGGDAEGGLWRYFEGEAFMPLVRDTLSHNVAHKTPFFQEYSLVGVPRAFVSML
jgi:hypothetical protein